MTKQNVCSGCGIVSKIRYCPQCEEERHDPNIKPVVWVYVDGTLGVLCNRRDAQFFLTDVGFKPTQHFGAFGLPAYERQPGGFPARYALLTLDGCVVVFYNSFDMESLYNHPVFMERPIIGNLPDIIEALHPEDFDNVKKIAGHLWENNND